MKKIKWIFGPCSYKNNTGIGLYSKLFVEKLKERYFIKEECIFINPKSTKRYLYQIFIYPIKILRGNFDINILYEEGLIYLTPLLFIRKRKNIIIYHHLPYEESLTTKWGKIKFRLIDFLSKKFLSLFDRIVVPSNVIKTELKERYFIPDKKILVIYNAFDIKSLKRFFLSKNRISKRELLKKYNILYNDGDIILLNVGSDENRKNLYTLVQAMIMFYENYKPKGKKIILINIGKSFDSRNRKKIINKTKNKNVPVYLLGEVSLDDLLKFYNISDIFISPSLYEGFGRTVIEAQIFNIPVVCSDIPIYREILGDSAYFVQNPHKINSWINVLKHVDIIMVEKEKYIKMGQKNIKRFDIEILFKQWINILEGL